MAISNDSASNPHDSTSISTSASVVSVVSVLLLVDIPSSLPNEKIIVLASNSSSVCMEA